MTAPEDTARASRQRGTVSPPPLNPVSADSLLGLRVDHLWERLGWLIRLRWFAIVGVCSVLGVSWWTGAVANEVPLGVVAGLLFVANLSFVRWHNTDRRPGGLDRLQTHATAQLVVDVLALVALLHWSDGVENPFAMFFAFHAAIAAKLLPGPRAFFVAGVAVAGQCGTVIAEHYGWLAHHPLVIGPEGEPDIFIESPLYLAGYVTAFTLTVLGTSYFVSSATRRFHHELEHRARLERVAASRARLAHLGEVAAGVAHSIRNPLHGVLNCVELLRPAVAENVDAIETLALMEEGLRRIETLTHRMLTLTRDAPLHLQPTELGEIVEASLRFVDPEGVELVDRPGGAGTIAVVDTDRVCEALASVLDNAIHACRNGGRVTVRVLGPVGPEAPACIEVCDTGEGIPGEQLGKVFDMFFTTKAVGEGTGLGLAITRRIMEEHGGAVTLDSDRSGTCVRLFFPQHPPEGGAP